MSMNHSVIVGGTRGLGKMVTKVLSADGHKLSILGRTTMDDSDEKNYYEKIDLIHEDNFIPAIKNIIATRGKINNVIFLQRFKGDGDKWQGELEISVNSTRKMIEACKDDFSSPASIVIVTSVMGRFANNSQPISYSIAKAALDHMVRYYAAELGPKGVRVNAVSPITFIKDESKKFYLEEKPEINALYESIVPLKRMCTTEDVANVIQFLASPRASYISGQNISVDGGLSVVSHETLARNLKGI